MTTAATLAARSPRLHSMRASRISRPLTAVVSAIASGDHTPPISATFVTQLTAGPRTRGCGLQPSGVAGRRCNPASAWQVAVGRDMPFLGDGGLAIRHVLIARPTASIAPVKTARPTAAMRPGQATENVASSDGPAAVIARR